MKLTIIGAGKMGQALGRGMLNAGLVAPGDLTFTDTEAACAQLTSVATETGAQTSTDNRQAVSAASVVILAVKPGIIPEVCAEIASALPAGVIVLSIAAGVTLRRLTAALNRDDIVLARAMPNVACLVGAGAIGLSFPQSAPAAARETIARLLAPTGLVEELPESMLDAVTGLSGSGPAYVAILIEALADGGVQMGLPRAQAQRLAAQTVFGTAKMLRETGQHPAQFKDAVSSPGGTTIAAIATLERAGFRAAAMDAVTAATMRSRELSGE